MKEAKEEGTAEEENANTSGGANGSNDSIVVLESIKHALEVIERIEEDLEADSAREELRKSGQKLPAEKSQSVL